MVEIQTSANENLKKKALVSHSDTIRGAGRSIAARLVDFAVFVATLLVSLVLILSFALATPFIVLLSFLAGRLNGQANSNSWITEKVTQRAS